MTEWWDSCWECEHFIYGNTGGWDDDWCRLHFETMYEFDQACDDFKPRGANE